MKDDLIIGSLFNNLSPWLESATILFLLIWMYRRSGSFYPLISLMWRKSAGKEEVKNRYIKECLACKRDLHEFRTFTSLRVRSVKHAEAVIKWCKQKDISDEEIKACKNLFDLEKLSVRTERLPSKGKQCGLIIFLFGVLPALLYLSALMALDNKVILQFNNHGKYVLLSEFDALPVFSPISNSFINPLSETFKKDQCDKASDEKLGIFTIGETKIICDEFKTSDFKEKIEKNLKLERFIFGWFCLMFCGCVWIMGAYYGKVKACERLLGKLSSVNDAVI